MTAPLFPIAAGAEAALSAPAGRAAREGQARALAGRDVEFITEPAGPAFETRAAAMAAMARFVGEGVGPEDRFCQLREVLAQVSRGKRPAPPPVEPSFSEGRRWPAAPAAPARTVWRLSVSYWRPVDPERFAALEQARLARRRADAEVLDAQTLRALAGQPLRPVRPQQPLDVGLFEIRLPENPALTMPDE